MGKMPMGQLLDTIRRLVADEKYVVDQPASERLEERGFLQWQVVIGLEDGELIAERSDATPVLVRFTAGKAFGWQNAG
jgi:hypothetical protein